MPGPIAAPRKARPLLHRRLPPTRRKKLWGEVPSSTIRGTAPDSRHVSSNISRDGTGRANWLEIGVVKSALFQIEGESRFVNLCNVSIGIENFREPPLGIHDAFWREVDTAYRSIRIVRRPRQLAKLDHVCRGAIRCSKVSPSVLLSNALIRSATFFLAV